jgi:glycerol-3-phosphate acyltransferase PlsX|tara:strand:- start:1949 stop:2968 length:1020 start_codon:yes stop_codon:yes gene_type:complete
MPQSIAIDVMGGDVGPNVTIPAAIESLKRHPNLQIILVGNEDTVKTNLLKYSKKETSRIKIRHAAEVVLMDESPQSALKNKKDSSMRVAINLIKSGEASACVSAGNTGALMATARFVLKTLPGIDRPAIASLLPSIKGTTCLLDLGANVDSSPKQLLQFAIMGAMLSSVLKKEKTPSVGLLNIGSEDIKGSDVVKEAYKLLSGSHLNFYGNVEGNDIFKGTTDVVVCDGFVGNISLKTTEGLAHMMGKFLIEEFKRSIVTKIMAFIATPVLRSFKRRLDPRRYNGASFLGLNGIVVKSHGSTDAYGFRFAIETAVEEVENQVIDKIRKQLEIESLVGNN